MKSHAKRNKRRFVLEGLEGRVVLSGVSALPHVPHHAVHQSGAEIHTLARRHDHRGGHHAHDNGGGVNAGRHGADDPAGHNANDDNGGMQAARPGCR